jgi:hypothetical protein
LDVVRPTSLLDVGHARSDAAVAATLTAFRWARRSTSGGVEDLETDRRLVLVAEMLLPGKAWLQWSVEPGSAGTLLVQTARFRPRGRFGRVYWYLVAPFHGNVFPGLVKGIARDAVDQ